MAEWNRAFSQVTVELYFTFSHPIQPGTVISWAIVCILMVSKTINTISPCTIMKGLQLTSIVYLLPSHASYSGQLSNKEKTICVYHNTTRNIVLYPYNVMWTIFPRKRIVLSYNKVCCSIAVTANSTYINRVTKVFFS